MATTYRLLAHVDLAASTSVTDIYQPAASTWAVISTIVVCNRNTIPTKFRLAHSQAVGGVPPADANNQQLYYDVTIAANDTFVTTIGICMSPSDMIRAKQNDANCLTITVYGAELT